MGLFLNLSGIVGINEADLISSLKDYLNSIGGGLQKADVDSHHKNFCTIEWANSNATIFFPAYFSVWEECSQFISKNLNLPIFSCHIHDGDLWMYTMYVNGKIVDKFCPIPDYWDENINPEEIESWKGNAEIIAQYIPGLNAKDIKKYLVIWDLDNPQEKAYPDDEFTNCDWQLIDFLRKLNLPYPIDDEGHAKGQVFKMWAKDLPLNEKPTPPSGYVVGPNHKTSWWKFW